MTSQRLQSIHDHVAPSLASTPLPSFDDLPQFHEYRGCAWGLWGSDDQLGTINILSQNVIQRAAQEEIQ
jgi:hypothetical protein